MYADDVRILASAATIEFAMSGDGTALTWTGQGAYVDGIDGVEAHGRHPRHAGPADKLLAAAGAAGPVQRAETRQLRPLWAASK